jgi:hypothetical protein
MNETINPVTFVQVISGIELYQSSIISLLTLALILAFGVSYGFNVIYNREKINRFREYRDVLKKNFIFELRRISLKTENFDEDIEDFINRWSEYGKIRDIYDSLLKWRGIILMIFLVSSLAYFNRLLFPTLILFGYKISFISNLSFFLGIICLIYFGWILFRLDRNLARYDLEKSDSKEEFNKLINKLFNKNNSK